VVTAYSPLGSPNSIAKADSPAPLKDPKLQEIAKKHKKSVAQIILRYLVSSHTTWHYNPEDHRRHVLRRENLKSLKFYSDCNIKYTPLDNKYHKTYDTRITLSSFICLFI
jgi:diketogulonate reductase-like aldo/keto reductase